MNLPGVRITVRWLMIAVAVVALSLFADLVLFNALYLGRDSIPLEFLILDSATGRPISRASIWLAEGNPEYRATTGSDGRAKFIIQAFTAGRSSLLRRTRAVAYIHWSLVISADGYVGVNDSLRQYTLEPRFHSDPVPPRIVIRLRPGS